MFENLSLRSKLIAIAVPPLVVLTAVAIYGLLLSVGGIQDNLVGDVRTLGIVALAGVILTALVGVIVARSIIQPVDEITNAAQELAENRLPLLVEALQSPGATPPEFAPIEVKQSDELGTLVEALNKVQASATSVAREQQRMLRQGLSELVVNMARRNQSLLDRQIEYIDRLESAEEDPDRLEELFGLDHLATRMRRNAESLLVLAGAESARRRGGPVAVGDVLRVAMSEIEDYRHVQLLSIEEAEIGAQGAVDLAHLVSELMENATQFSPPDAPVEVNGTIHPDGSYLISIADHGIGMSEEQIQASNQIIAAPPELGLSLSRSLGFIVIGRLAQRLDVRVELVQTPAGGVTAIIDVPSSVLHGGSAPLSTTVEPSAELPAAEATPPMPAATLATPGAPVVTDPAPALDTNPFGDPPPPTPAETETWQPPVPPAPAGAPQPEPTAMPVAEEETWQPPTPPAPGGAPLPSMTPPAPAPVAEEETWQPPIPPAPGTAMPGEDGLAMPGEDGLAPDAASVPVAEEESWEPPSLPERGANPLVSKPAAELPEEAAGSEALAKLLGLDPIAATEPAPTTEPAPAAEPEPGTIAPAGGGSDLFSRPAPAAPSEPVEETWDGPVFDPSQPFDQVSEAPAPEKLDDAIPSGENFDEGMSSLLSDPSATGGEPPAATGLAKRDRSQSQAPISEGRPVAASVRSPEEIRSMLARYRDGLKGRPLEGIANDGADASSTFDSPDGSGPTNNGTENNPWGDSA